MKLTKWLSISLILSFLVGVAGVSVYGIYKVSADQSKNTFITHKYTTIKNLFKDKNEPPYIKETTIAGEKGYIVNKGPIRISSAYNSLFDKQSLINIANWFYENVNWGANALSLKNITFTTGIDKGSNGVTKGFHTAGRDGSAIFISPDAFEEIGRLGDELFKSYSKKIIERYETSFVAQIKKMQTDPTINFLDIVNENLDNFLKKSFNASTNIGQQGVYKKITLESIIKILETALRSTWNDDFLSKIPGSQLKTMAQTTKFGDLNFTKPEKIAYLIKANKMSEAITRRNDKIAFDLAYQSVWKSTGGKGALGNIYLQLMLRNIIFKEDLKADGQTITYKVRDRAEWDKISGVHKDTNPINSTNDKAGYFRSLWEQGVTKIGVQQRASIYLLFINYYDAYLDLLENKSEYFKAIKSMWNDKSIILLNNWINHVSKFDASSRVNWLLTGAYPQKVEMSVLPMEEWMLNSQERNKIKHTKSIFDRKIFVDMGKILRDSIEKHVIPELGKGETIKNFYKNHLLESMKYTLSHEYGHHETMWSNYGNYGPASKLEVGVFDKTIGLYSESRAAGQISSIAERPFLLIIDMAQQPGFSALQNPLQIMIRAGDKYSGTWTESYFGHKYYGFTPISNRWSYAYEDLLQPKLVFGQNENGATTISLGSNEFVGRTPIAFNTNGVDSGTDNSKTNYLYNIDRTKMSIDNPIRKFDPRRVGNFLRMLISPDELLYGYQLSKWLIAGHRRGDKWSIANEVPLPEINSLTLDKPTTYFSPILAQDPSDKVSKMMTIMGVLRLQLGLSIKHAKEVINALDQEVKKLYEQLVGKHNSLDEPPLFMPKITSDIDRSKIIFKQIISNTKKTIGQRTDFIAALKEKPGIYYDPSTISYQSIGEMLPTYKQELTRFLNDYKKSALREKGTVNLGQAVNRFADYTGNYAEFMTRLLNQLAFRPQYDKYKIKDGTLDTSTLIAYNEGWYDDMNRFRAQGFNLYNISDGQKSYLTKMGAAMINWLRESLGLHVGDAEQLTNIKMINGKVDYKALDNSIQWAEPLFKIYKNYKTNLTTMWGWIPNDKVATYKYVLLTNQKSGQKIKVDLQLKNTSNYFYYEDMNNDKSKKHTMNNGFTQWVSSWMIEGNYANTDLNIGDYELQFADENGNVFNPYEGMNLPNNIASFNETKRTANDYEPIIAPITWIIIIDQRKIVIRVLN